MKRQILTAALLLFGLSGLGAMAQNSSTTPGIPSPNDPNTYPNPQATAPDQPGQQDQDRDPAQTSTDQQQYPDSPHRDRDRGNNKDVYSPDDAQQNSASDMDRDRDHDRDRNSQDSNQYPQAGDRDRTPQSSDQDRYNRDRNYNRTDNTYDHDRDRVSGGNGYANDIQSALQQRDDLRGVTVSDSGSHIELSGTVPTGHARRQAERVAQSFAHGRQVVNNIQVSGNRNDYDRDRQQ